MKVNVLINKNDTHRRPTGQETIEATVVRETPKTLWVQLPDGNIIRRKKSRLPK